MHKRFIRIGFAKIFHSSVSLLVRARDNASRWENVSMSSRWLGCLIVLLPMVALCTPPMLREAQIRDVFLKQQDQLRQLEDALMKNEWVRICDGALAGDLRILRHEGGLEFVESNHAKRLRGVLNETGFDCVTLLEKGGFAFLPYSAIIDDGSEFHFRLVHDGVPVPVGECPGSGQSREREGHCVVQLSADWRIEYSWYPASPP